MSKLFENTVCLAVTFHRPGDQRRFKAGEVEVRKADYSDAGNKADQSMISASKRIFRNGHYAETVRIDAQFTEWLKRRALDCPLRRGTYLVPIGLLDEVYEELDFAQRRYEEEADLLVSEYEVAKAGARARLRELYSEKDYPSAEQLRQRFWVERQMFDFSPPGESKLSEAVYRQEKERWAESFASAELEVKQALRQSCRDLVAHLADKLAPSADGKRKRLHDSAVEKLVEFFDLFDRRNVLNDTELKSLVDRARKLVNGNAAESLRENDTLREFVGQQMQEITVALDALIVEGPRRVFSFEED